MLLEPGAGVRVLPNDAEVTASVRATRATEAGEDIRESDFDVIQDLRPAGVPEDAAWVALAVLSSGRQVATFRFQAQSGQGPDPAGAG